MKHTLIILIFFAAGIAAGTLDLLPAFVQNTASGNLVLYLLLFWIGVSLGADRNLVRLLRAIHYKIIIVPVGVALGTLAGAAAASWLLTGVSYIESMAVGAGFGWYSLSALFITQLHSETLGITALLSNVIREMFTLAFAPLLASRFGPLSIIASGGATSMDTTLPVVLKYSGKEFLLMSIFSGFALSLLVPVIINFLLK